MRAWMVCGHFRLTRLLRHLEEMKPVVDGLVLPHELEENRRLARERRKNLKRLKQVVRPIYLNSRPLGL